MAIKIKLITTKDFLNVTAERDLDLNTSRQRLLDVARSEQPPADYEVLVDFRDTPYPLSRFEVAELASEFCRRGDTFRRKVALLVLPGIDFDPASFFETYSLSLGLFVKAFIDYEMAMPWMLTAEEAVHPVAGAPPAQLNDGSFPRLIGERWQL